MKSENHYHFGVALTKIREEAIQLHRRRYLEVGFFQKGEKDLYEQDSLYFVARETTLNQVVGVTRLIFKPIEQLPTIKNFEIYEFDLVQVTKLEKSQLAEMSAFTKLPKHEVGVHLIRTIFHYSKQQGITHWIACIDDRVFRYLNRIFSSIFKEIGVPKVYLGSVTVPCLVDLPKAMKQIKEQRPKLYEFLKGENEQVMEVSR
jgi:N-acyl-L-homoserine lactone synthetase